MGQLHLTAGLRFDALDVDGEQQNNMVLVPYSATVEHKEWLPKISAAYDITPNMMAYATVSRSIESPFGPMQLDIGRVPANEESVSE